MGVHITPSLLATYDSCVGSKRPGLAQTPLHLRLSAGALGVFAVAAGLYALAAGRPSFWGFALLFLVWAAYFVKLAARWQREEDQDDVGRPRTS